MGRKLRIRISPATALAALALFVALAGTSLAAVSAVLPANSVGTAQLRNGAVTAAKVRQGSLLASNFRAGQLPRGALGPTGPAGPAGPTGPAGPAGPAGGAASTLWAVVNTSGSIARSSGTTSAGHLGTGDYEVIFNKDVSKCVYSASAGSTTTGTPGAIIASVGSRTGNTSGVEVTTFNAAGTATDAPFHLAVFC